MAKKPWEILFRRALAQMDNAGIPKDHWAFGGGTVLQFEFNHRDSKDIDIFFNKPELFDGLSPEVNHAVAANLIHFTTHFQHIRLWFKEGEIDFVLTRQITQMKPRSALVLDVEVNVEHPVEIIAKKIYHRAEEFKPRDIFDLAVVSGGYRNKLLENAAAFAKELSVVARRLDEIEKTGEFEEVMKTYTILPGGKQVRGKEIALCRQFVEDAFHTLV